MGVCLCVCVCVDREACYTPCCRSRWRMMMDWRVRSCSVCCSSSPPAPSAAPAGSRCSWWRSSGSPLWEVAGWDWPRCSGAELRRRGSPSSAGVSRAWWRLAGGPRCWLYACRLYRPTAGSSRPRGGPRGPGRARPRPIPALPMGRTSALSRDMKSRSPC